MYVPLYSELTIYQEHPSKEKKNTKNPIKKKKKKSSLASEWEAMILGALFREGNEVQAADAIFINVNLPTLKFGRFRIYYFWSLSSHYLRSPTAFSHEMVGGQHWPSRNKLLITKPATTWKTHCCLDLLVMKIVYCGIN